MPNDIDIIKLRDLITQYFSLSEIQDLIFTLGISTGTFASLTTITLARELVEYCQRLDLLDELLIKVRDKRQHVDWDVVLSKSDQPVRSQQLFNETSLEPDKQIPSNPQNNSRSSFVEKKRILEEVVSSPSQAPADKQPEQTFPLKKEPKKSKTG